MGSIATKEELKKIINSDLFRYFGDTSKIVFRQTYRFIPGFRFSYWMRRCNYYSGRSKATRPLFYLARFRYKQLKYKFGYDIEYSTRIGEGFYLGHWGGVVINKNAVIGKNCNISHQVTVGVDSKRSGEAAPVIGDGVYLAPGSKIFGKVTLGDGCAVGANSVVNKDVPAGVTAAGVPAVVVSENGSLGYINNTVP